MWEHLSLQLPWFTNLFTAFTLAAGGYSVVRSGVRFFNVALPGQCVTNTIVNFNLLSTGNCPAADPNWLLTRVSFATSAHAWSWVMYGSFAIFFTVWPRPMNGVRGFMFTGLAIAYHELTWFATYFALHPSTIVGNLNVYGSFIAAMGIGVAIFFVTKYHHEFNLKAVLLFSIPYLVFQFFWALQGFPLSLDLVQGISPLFSSVYVNAVEWLSWVFIFLAVGGGYAYSVHLRKGV